MIWNINRKDISVRFRYMIWNINRKHIFLFLLGYETFRFRNINRTDILLGLDVWYEALIEKTFLLGLDVWYETLIGKTFLLDLYIWYETSIEKTFLSGLDI